MRGFDTHMIVSLSGLKGNCVTSQRKLLAERDISKRDNSDEEKKEKKCCTKEVASCSHLWTQESFTAGASLHALPQKSIGLKSLSNTNLWALHNSPCNSHVHSLRALQHFILQISFTCQPSYPWNSHETSLRKNNTFKCILSKYPARRGTECIPSFLIRHNTALHGTNTTCYHFYLFWRRRG